MLDVNKLTRFQIESVLALYYCGSTPSAADLLRISFASLSADLLAVEKVVNMPIRKNKHAMNLKKVVDAILEKAKEETGGGLFSFEKYFGLE